MPRFGCGPGSPGGVSWAGKQGGEEGCWDGFWAAFGPWSAPSVTEKCDPRHSCPVLSWTSLSVCPELQQGPRMQWWAQTKLTHIVLFSALTQGTK